MIGIITYLCTIIEDQTYFIHEITSSHKGNEDFILFMAKGGRQTIVYLSTTEATCMYK